MSQVTSQHLQTDLVQGVLLDTGLCSQFRLFLFQLRLGLSFLELVLQLLQIRPLSLSTDATLCLTQAI